jgi:hypothetical protein
MIALQEARRELDEIKTRFEETENELNRLDVYSLDPVQGLALIPFVREEQLAWFIFDLFDPEPLRFWRFQDDPLDARRLIPIELRRLPNGQ